MISTKRIEKKNRVRNNNIVSFFEEKFDLYNDFGQFEKTFKHLLANTKGDCDVYILDELSDEQKIQFVEYYSYARRGSGTLYSNKYCNDKVYRTEFIFSEKKLVLIS